MKKFYIALLLIAFSFPSFAQVVITHTDMLEIGESANFSVVNVIGVSPGPSGQGAVWDFSNLTSIGSTTTSTAVLPSSTPQGSSFPGSNLALTYTGSPFVVYQNLTPSMVQQIGAFNGSVVMNFSDPEDLWPFPLQYGTTHSDDFYSSFVSNTVPMVREGSVTVEADGEGTLILPSGTYNNVLRVKRHQVYTDSMNYMGAIQIIHYDVIVYYYLMVGAQQSAFQFTEMTIDGNTTFSGVVNDNITSGLGPIKNELSAQIYPNPASDQLFIEVAQREGISYRIHSSLGQVMDVGQLDSEKINIEDLPKGLYFINLKSEEGETTVKFQKM